MQWEDFIGQEFTFVGYFRKHYDGMMLLENVHRDDGVKFRDHLHVPFTKRFKKLGLCEGDCLKISGKVNRYYKSEDGLPRGAGDLVVRLAITNIKVLEVVEA